MVIEADNGGDKLVPLDDVPNSTVASAPVSMRGETRTLGEHKMWCGIAPEGDDYARLGADKPAKTSITDPLFNIPVADNA